MLPRSPIFVRSNYRNLTLGWEPCPQETVRTRRNPSVTVINPWTHHDLSVMMGESGTSPLVTARPLDSTPELAGDEPDGQYLQARRQIEVRHLLPRRKRPRHKKTGATDKQVTERIARDIENRTTLRRERTVDPKAEAYRDHEATPLADHIADWQADLIARGHTVKHADHTSNRVRRLVTVVLGSSPSRSIPDGWRLQRGNMTAHWLPPSPAPDSPPSPPTRFKVPWPVPDSGSSLQTCNHYRAAVRAFSKWLHKRNGPGRHVPRRDWVQRQGRPPPRPPDLALDDLRTLIDVAADGTGLRRHGRPRPSALLPPGRGDRTSLCGDRQHQPRVFRLEGEPATVTVAAGYTKNGQPATLPLPPDLADDLAAYVATVAPGTAVFRLPVEKGAKMLRATWPAAGIAYRDASGWCSTSTRYAASARPWPIKPA